MRERSPTSRASTAFLVSTCIAVFVIAAEASADPYADLVISGPPGAAEALGACDGVAVDITGSELIVAFTDNYLVNPDNSPGLDGRAYQVAGPGCEPVSAYASPQGPPQVGFFDWAPISDPLEYDLLHQQQIGDFDIGVPHFWLRIIGPGICETPQGDPLPTTIDCVESLNPVTLVDDDVDTVDDRVDNCAGIANPTQSDIDADWLGDVCDNCMALGNSPIASSSFCDQFDADLDGYGNACDSDFNNDGATGLDDLTDIISMAGTSNPAMDLNCDGGVGLDDLNQTLVDHNVPVGPSGLACAGTIPCTAP